MAGNKSAGQPARPTYMQAEQRRLVRVCMVPDWIDELALVQKDRHAACWRRVQTVKIGWWAEVDVVGAIGTPIGVIPQTIKSPREMAERGCTWSSKKWWYRLNCWQI